MTQHTQGPWRYKMHCDTNYAIIYCHNDNHEGDNLRGYCGEANARLIAATPELLEALIEARDQYVDANSIAYPEDKDQWPLLLKMEKAIAKAKGKE